MTDIEKLEAAVGKSVEQWNVSDLDKFSLDENLETLKLLKKSEVLKECIKRSKENKEIIDILNPLLIKSLLVKAEEESNDILSQFAKKELTSDELLVKCNDFISDNSESVYKRLIGYLMIITIFPDQKLLDKEIKIKEDVSEIKEIICNLSEQDLYSCYTLIEDLLEVIIPLRQRYATKNNIDILDDEDKKLEATLDALVALKSMLGQSVETLVESQQKKSKDKGETTDE